MRRSFQSLKALAVAVVLAMLSIGAVAQVVGFSAKEDEPDTILKLEDFVAQCPDPAERSVFQYVQGAKRLSWYRSEYFSAERELRLDELRYGVRRSETGQPSFDGYADVRDLPLDGATKKQPYKLSRGNYPDFAWVSRPRPTYSLAQCSEAAQIWKLKLAEVFENIREPFPEISRHLALVDPNEVMSISRLIGDCRPLTERPPPFIDSTSFEAWLSNSFSSSYGRREKVSRPLYEQLRNELRVLGGMARAARGFATREADKGECDAVKDRIYEYYGKHRLW